MSIESEVRTKANHWLESPVIDAGSKAEIKKLLAESDPKDLIDSFYKELEFGTGGLRGVMGVGSNCMNRYTLGTATQGLSNYLLKTYPNKKIKVAIAFDSRENSDVFAKIVADVFSANGITVYLFPELRPTPLLSFAIRYLKCDSGVVITASHNPKEYNGYKAYWNDGAQVIPPHDENIIEEVNKISSFELIKFNSNPDLIHTIGAEVEEAYYAELLKLIPNPEIVSKHKDIPIVFSSIHGTGITMVPIALERMAFTNIHIVEEQAKPDGKFPTVKSPNPEEKSAMELAIQLADKVDANMVFATDPDADRVGVGIRDQDGAIRLLNGNEAFSLLMWFLLKNQKDVTNAYIAKTIVTSELVDSMAAKLGVECYNTLTGFKYIASLMGKLEGKKRFIAAGEESYGYMVGDFIRDKDAVSACAFFAALAAHAVDAGKSLYEWMIEMHSEFGFYKEHLINVTKKGQQGAQEIKALMEKFRNNPPSEIGGSKIVRLLDYQSLTEKNHKNGASSKLDFPSSNVLQFYLEDGTKLSIRPSGTEPKIKFYISVNAEVKDKSDYGQVSQLLDQRIEKIEQYLNSI